MLLVGQVNETMSNIERLFQPGEHMWVMTEEKDPHGFFSEMKATYNVIHYTAARVVVPIMVVTT